MVGLRLGDHAVGGPRDGKWNVFIAPNRWIRCEALLHSLFGAGAATAWFVMHWITARKKGFVFRVRSAARYEGIADTFVQLLPSCSAGLIASVQGAVESKRYGKKQDSNCNAREERRQEEAMSVLELQPIVNAVRGLPFVSGNHGICDEHSLVAKAKSGHDDAFGELYQRHHRKAYGTALRILRNQQDAEDAVQRAFQRALVNLQRFREDSTFSTWLTRIVINEALMLLRQRRKPEPLHENNFDAAQGDGGVELADGGPTPEEILCESERRATLRQAIAELRDNLRVVVLHRELQGLTSAETARRLGLTVSAVKSRTFHARRFLRKHLERNLKGAGALGKLQKRKA